MMDSEQDDHLTNREENSGCHGCRDGCRVPDVRRYTTRIAVSLKIPEAESVDGTERGT